MQNSRVYLLLAIAVLISFCINCKKKTTDPDNQPPNMPSNPFPPHSSIDQWINTCLCWTGGDPDGDPVVYDIHFGTSSPPPFAASMLVDTFYIPGILLPYTQYYWRIVARDTQDLTAGNIWYFTTGNTSLLPPENLALTADFEGDGLVISWDQMNGIDGYELTTPDGYTVPLQYDETAYNDDTPNTTGIYSVCAVLGPLKSQPATIRSAPYRSTVNATIYVYSDPNPSGFGWNVNTGIGTVYDCTFSNADYIDFYLNDISISMPFNFTSCDEPPYSGNKITNIVNMGNSDFSLAPSTGYCNTERVVTGNYYAINVQDDYYGKVYVVSSTTGDQATFSYKFQAIQGFRHF